jgi:two-component system chemotaxis response regulator CheB
MRDVIKALLGSNPRIQIIGEATDGQDAVEQAKKLRPDVITLDVQMPRLTGIDAISAIMAEAPSRVIVVCGVSQTSAVDLSFRAMAAGALEVIPKPQGGPAELIAFVKRLAESVLLMAEVPVVTRKRAVHTPPHPMLGLHAIDVVGIAASTGGPPALATILGSLPRGFRVPLIIAQHMAPGFGAGLVRWFGEVSPVPVRVATSGMALVPGHVYLPPDGHDIITESGGVIAVMPNLGGHCPNANVLFDSLAKVYRVRAAGIVLTGMGDDGAEGLLRLRKAGGITVAQDEATSVVYGMPQAAIKLGAASDTVPLHDMADLLKDLAHRSMI